MLVILAAATVASTPAPRVFVERPVLAAAPTLCAPTGRYEVADPALLYRYEDKVSVTPLGALPKADHEKAVLRTVDGCSAPLVVRYGVGR